MSSANKVDMAQSNTIALSHPLPLLHAVEAMRLPTTDIASVNPNAYK